MGIGHPDSGIPNPEARDRQVAEGPLAQFGRAADF